MKVKTVKTGYEGSKDCLDGKPLCKGHKVKITFPDGHTEQVVISTTTTLSQEGCHNDKWTEKHTAAYVRIIVHGVGLRIRLSENNLDVERVK